MIYWCCQDKPQTHDWKVETIPFAVSRDHFISNRWLICLFACMHIARSEIKPAKIISLSNHKTSTMAIIPFFSDSLHIIFIFIGTICGLRSTSSFDTIAHSVVQYLSCDNWKIDFRMQFVYFCSNALRSQFKVWMHFSNQFDMIQTAQSGWPRTVQNSFQKNLIELSVCVCA